eukprot:1193154-Prorocentrum_minimum.AAC.1
MDFTPMQPEAVHLFAPVVAVDSSPYDAALEEEPRPLCVYMPGLDGTGQGIRRQVEHLHKAGLDVRCLYIPPGDRSTWQQLTSQVLPLLERAACIPAAQSDANAEGCVPLTLVAESFFTPLALRLTAAAPALVLGSRRVSLSEAEHLSVSVCLETERVYDVSLASLDLFSCRGGRLLSFLVTKLVLVNPTTAFVGERPNLSAAADMAAGFGLLELMPDPLYHAAQDMMHTLLVQRNRISEGSNEGIKATELKGNRIREARHSSYSALLPGGHPCGDGLLAATAAEDVGAAGGAAGHHQAAHFDPSERAGPAEPVAGGGGAAAPAASRRHPHDVSGERAHVAARGRHGP